MGGRILIAFGKFPEIECSANRHVFGIIAITNRASLILLIKTAFVLTMGLILSACPHYNSGLPPSLRLPPLKQDSPASGIFHTVMPNESLSWNFQAWRRGLTDFGEVNNLGPLYAIRANSKIFIPGASDARKWNLLLQPFTRSLK
jgi:hypothetical protein